MTTPTKILDTQELAEYLRSTVPAIRNMRYRGTGPQGVRVGRKTLYRLDDVNAWFESQLAREGAAAAEQRSGTTRSTRGGA